MPILNETNSLLRTVLKKTLDDDIMFIQTRIYGWTTRDWALPLTKSSPHFRNGK